MTLLALDIPAGFHRNGTDFEQSNKWRDGSLVRWRDGSLRPVKGWDPRKTSFSTNIIRGMHAWESLDGSVYLAGGSYNELKALVGTNSLYDITPSNLTSGLEKASIISGYGYGDYGAEDYGDARENYGSYSEATTWSLDNWGEYLVACSSKVGGSGDGRLLEWQLVTNPSELVTNGTFNTDLTGWTYSSTYWQWATGGSARHKGTGPAPAPITQEDLNLENGKVYTVSFTTTNLDSDLNVKIGTDIGYGGEVLFLNETVSTNATHTFTFTVTSGATGTYNTNMIRFYNNSGTDAYNIDTVTVKQAIVAQPISNAPIDCLGLVVTEERFLFALGGRFSAESYANPRKVYWCDQEDNTTWTAATTNQAGSQELQTSGMIMQGLRTRGQTLILTDIDAHVARFVGSPFIFGFERVGTACGTISRKAAVDVDMGAFWMGQRGFFAFQGNTVQQLPCDVHDYVFDDFNRDQQSQIWAWSNVEYGEIWWFYPSSNSQEVDRYVAYNYNENYWITGDLSRTSGVSRGVFKYPLLAATNKTIYEHERTFNYDGADVFAETGPISLGNGEQTMSIMQLIPDEKSQGEVSLKFKTRFYPNGTETTHGPYTPANPTGVRFSGRQFRMRIDGIAGEDWRVGNMRVDAFPAGKR